MNLSASAPIGFLDSGLGGISVLKEAVKLLPNENFIYYGDSANAPYGIRPREEIRALTFQAVEHLLSEGIKGLCVACNTATAAAVRSLREMYPELPIVGIEPAIKPAVEQYGDGEIIVMATPMTISQEKYNLLLSRFAKETKIYSVPCKGLMEFVEEGKVEGEELISYLEHTLSPHLHPRTKAIVLGCTHYPFIKKQLSAFLADRDIALIDGSYGTALELKRRLMEKSLLSSDKAPGIITFENSSDDPVMLTRSKMLFSL